MGRISLVLDSGAVTALARGNIAARSRVREALKTIDAIVVATADLAPGSAILTGDERDITTLANVERLTAVLPI
jgi:predicted nucleic acid-binding protein